VRARGADRAPFDGGGPRARQPPHGRVFAPPPPQPQQSPVFAPPQPQAAGQQQGFGQPIASPQQPEQVLAHPSPQPQLSPCAAPPQPQTANPPLLGLTWTQKQEQRAAPSQPQDAAQSDLKDAHSPDLDNFLNAEAFDDDDQECTQQNK
jgi:hypothetical protein